MKLKNPLELIEKQSKFVGLESDTDVHQMTLEKITFYKKHLSSEPCAATMNNVYDNTNYVKFNDDMSTASAKSVNNINKYIQNTTISK